MMCTLLSLTAGFLIETYICRMLIYIPYFLSDNMEHQIDVGIYVPVDENS